jgi:ArsR family transcriptional regulator, arsenate/arsenite/antimonite-responsive transcriptional repressor / arsenate reductase (thioredoxin)
MEMTSTSMQLPDFLKALAHELRWKILVFLAHSDHNVAEIVRFLGQPQNVVSYHLRKLREHHVVTERRSSADSRDVYYSLDLDSFRFLYQATGEMVHPALHSEDLIQEKTQWHLPTSPLRVLFLCTKNSARSQMAEGILRHLSQQAIEVYSAGSQPSALHPFAIRAMTTLGIDIHQQHSKHVDEFQNQSFAYIVTVCDRMREVCPSFPGDADRIHWSIPDPIEVEGTYEEQYKAFERTARYLLVKIRYLLTSIEYEQKTHA